MGATVSATRSGRGPVGVVPLRHRGNLAFEQPFSQGMARKLAARGQRQRAGIDQEERGGMDLVLTQDGRADLGDQLDRVDRGMAMQLLDQHQPFLACDLDCQGRATPGNECWST